MSQPTNVQPLNRGDAETTARRVFVRDLELQAEIGIHAHEMGRTQPVRISIDLGIATEAQPMADTIDSVVCYEGLVNAVQAIVARGHIGLVETLADLIAERCFEDPRVLDARISVEKPDAIAQARSVGISIERVRQAPPRPRG